MDRPSKQTSWAQIYRPLNDIDWELMSDDEYARLVRHRMRRHPRKKRRTSPGKAAFFVHKGVDLDWKDEWSPKGWKAIRKLTQRRVRNAGKREIDIQLNDM